MIRRREFLRALGATGAGLAAAGAQRAAAAGGAAGTEAPAASVPAEARSAPARAYATVRVAFLYPPTESLKKEGYYSWPGSGFDAEGQHREMARKIEAIARGLGVRAVVEEKALTGADSVGGFIERAKAEPTDGLLLIPFKKSEWGSVKRIIEETKFPSIVYAVLGVLLQDHIRELHRTPGVHLISSVENLDAVAGGLRMIRALRRMRDSTILSIAGDGSGESVAAPFGTRVRRVPRARFAEAYQRTASSPLARDIAEAYRKGARRIVEPSAEDILAAARTTVACKDLIRAEGADALMMDCLGGIQAKLFPPPCMGYMSLRDEGIPMGCQNDLSATLSLMLVQYLFDRPGFQLNAASDTARNRFFGAHCTCPTRLRGLDADPAPYILRNHAEAGVGTVPQVLWPKGEPISLVQVMPEEKDPEIIVYGGRVVACRDTPPAGGCRTNVETTIDDIADAADVKGMHQAMILGDYAGAVRQFGRLAGIRVVS